MWTEFGIKFVDNFGKILENANLEIWAGFLAFYIVDRTREYSSTVHTIGNRLGPQIWQALRRRLP